MTVDLNRFYWMEAEEPVAAQAPATDPTTGIGAQQPPSPDPTQQPSPADDDVTQDPPEADVEQSEEKDFEQWRHDFFDLAIRSDVNEMMRSIKTVRDHDLEPTQRRFVEDNIAILLYRQDVNVIKATQELRKLITSDLDATNPATTVMQHLCVILEKQGLLQQVLIKLTGFYGLKGELHRKFLASLLGAVQVGGGNKHREDLIYSEREFSINLSTRFYTQFGEVNLGNWSLKEDDPDKYLSEPELKRLHEGNPEEKQVLRRRIILESIGETFKQRAFLIHCVHTDGTIYALGWDLGNCLLSAYKDGKVVVRGQKSQSRDAQIADDGFVVPLLDLDILYVTQTGETDDNGHPQTEEVPFLTRKDSSLYLVADIDTIRKAAVDLSGIFFNEIAYNGNPSDITQLQRCIPDLSQMLNGRCVGVAAPESTGKNKPF